ncbi:MAG: 5-methyltetrahydrofolate--homocysteine methyltransferase, partial [Vicingaceae bacterium]
PLLIGGATTSKAHTAVKISPEYDLPVVHVLDASRSVPVAGSLLTKDKAVKDKFFSDLKEEYSKIRDQFEAKRNQKKMISIENARKNAFEIDWKSTDIKVPSFTGTKVFDNYAISDLIPFIDWTPFFQTWELAGKYPNILEDEVVGVEAKKLFIDAKAMLVNIVDENWLQAKGVFGFWKANSVGDDIQLLADNGETFETLYTLRQQGKKAAKVANFALADFIAPKDSGREDYIGAFAVTSGIGIDEHIARFEADHDDYNSIMLKALADRLAEAFAERLHKEVRIDHWGYAENEGLDNESLIKEKYRGIRPAAGYPACPDHSEKEAIFRLLDAERLGITLTESYAMLPTAAVSGLYFANENSKYFGLGKVQKDQMENYAQRKGKAIEACEKWLRPNLNY